ncbi:MAG: type II toxin-antitoxin system HigA family antitoxin [Acidobacteriota bacterium]
MSARPIPDYPALLAKHPPRVIRTQAENEHFTRLLEDLDRRHATSTRAERELANLLTLLIEDFEERQYQIPRASPLEALRFLMDQHHLRQKDLLDIFGTPSVASEVLSGKRELSKQHIRALSGRFSVPVDLFF